ncbi:hypothetical protein M433DRAFT_114727 [Acidomyces richmondensis BFW]|nr:MAG: hypothetical protein FE78DRAFT_159982 [Acidomyces sp. 'richmondensis']KYG42011.1 hypothetical protein M433DRAFT_114727 [Acidomyces richmondensis BFW]
MATRTKRSSIVCDGCALRRVKCDGKDPCSECNGRNVACTHLRVRRKRGPKGPRVSTCVKIQAQAARLARPSLPNIDSYNSNPGGPPSLETYRQFFEIFQRLLYHVWPVLDVGDLMISLEADERNQGSQALADALCAAVIAQLRICHSSDRLPSQEAPWFAKEARRAQQAVDEEDECSLNSLLTSFFLHMYYANVQKLSIATLFLRETLTRAHMLGLQRPESYRHLGKLEFQRRLRIYWILFVTERTFCAENQMPTILDPIEVFPSPTSDDAKTAICLPALLDLTRLFVCLESQYCVSESGNASKPSAISEESRILNIQAQLQYDNSASALTEPQKVDLAVTRNWIRVLVWHYTFTRYPQSCQSASPAFSITYPATIAREVASTLSAASEQSLRAHGYGMVGHITPP